VLWLSWRLLQISVMSQLRHDGNQWDGWKHRSKPRERQDMSFAMKHEEEILASHKQFGPEGLDKE